jgi:hypothetical protein
MLVTILIILAVVCLYFLNKYAYKKVGAQQDLINKMKVVQSMYVIDKSRVKADTTNLPKAVKEQLPKIYKFIKINAVKAKIGPQILTLICDKKVFKVIPVKKNIKAELAGIYIISILGFNKKEKPKSSKVK